MSFPSARARASCRLPAWCLPLLLALACATPPVPEAADGPRHPLDPLSADEYRRVVSLLESAGHVDSTSRFPLITLAVPDKAAVTAWASAGGTPPPRRASVVVQHQRQVYEADVDLDAGAVDRWQAMPGVESSVMLDEWTAAQAAALAHPDMIAGLAARGVTDPARVFCAPFTMGYFDIAEDRGMRLLKVGCFDLRPSTNNVFAWPIEGLYAIVDLKANRTVRVHDSGAVPIASGNHNFTEADVGRLRDPLRPVTIALPSGGNVTLTGHEVAWQRWRFHYRVDRRQGPILSLVRYRDGDRDRSILYEAAMAEMFVPYMDPDYGWYSRTYFDMGEYGVGLFLSTLHRDVDCPGTAQFMSITINDDRGAPVETPDAVCLFERNRGDPSWRHAEFVNGTYQGRPAVELVLRTAAQIGNYDYLIDWVFNQAGEIDVAIGATGINALKGVAATSMASPSAAADTRYGPLVAPNLVSVNHDHFFSFRLDFDVDGVANRFRRDEYRPERLPAAHPRRSVYRIEPVEPRTDTEARTNPGHFPAKWRVLSASGRNAVGNPTSYEIVPQHHAAQLLSEDDYPSRRASFTRYALWVTPRTDAERFAAGDYVMGSNGREGLEAWTAGGRNIVDTDIVVWHTVGMHHLPRAEDLPVMPMVWSGFKLRPFDFFDRNPAVDLPTAFGR